MPQPFSRPFQVRRALLRHLAPRYQQASPAQKTLLLDSFVEWTGYTRKYAIELLNHGEQGKEIIQRRRQPQYRPPVQQALLLAWKATHYVCAKRLLPSLPNLVLLLEGQGHLCLMEESSLEENGQKAELSLSTLGLHQKGSSSLLGRRFGQGILDPALSSEPSAYLPFLKRMKILEAPCW